MQKASHARDQRHSQFMFPKKSPANPGREKSSLGSKSGIMSQRVLPVAPSPDTLTKQGCSSEVPQGLSSKPNFT
jgi:hypothetical protein